MALLALADLVAHLLHNEGASNHPNAKLPQLLENLEKAKLESKRAPLNLQEAKEESKEQQKKHRRSLLKEKETEKKVTGLEGEKTKQETELSRAMSIPSVQQYAGKESKRNIIEGTMEGMRERVEAARAKVHEASEKYGKGSPEVKAAAGEYARENKDLTESNKELKKTIDELKNLLKNPNVGNYVAGKKKLGGIEGKLRAERHRLGRRKYATRRRKGIAQRAKFKVQKAKIRVKETAGKEAAAQGAVDKVGKAHQADMLRHVGRGAQEMFHAAKAGDTASLAGAASRTVAGVLARGGAAGGIGTLGGVAAVGLGGVAAAMFGAHEANEYEAWRSKQAGAQRGFARSLAEASPSMRITELENELRKRFTQDLPRGEREAPAHKQASEQEARIWKRGEQERTQADIEAGRRRLEENQLEERATEYIHNRQKEGKSDSINRGRLQIEEEERAAKEGREARDLNAYGTNWLHKANYRTWKFIKRHELPWWSPLVAGPFGPALAPFAWGSKIPTSSELEEKQRKEKEAFEADAAKKAEQVAKEAEKDREKEKKTGEFPGAKTDPFAAGGLYESQRSTTGTYSPFEEAARLGRGESWTTLYDQPDRFQEH